MNVEATTDPERASRRLWDAIVIGAGPAGALAARELARRGVGVLLVDRARFPRGKVCGCCLNRRALDTLESVGLGALRTGMGQLSTIRLAAGGRQAEVKLPGSAVLSRERLDAELVTAAIEAGAAFLPETTARVGGLVPENSALSTQYSVLSTQYDGRSTQYSVLRTRDEGRGTPHSARLVTLGQHDTPARVVLLASGLATGQADVAPGSRVGAGAIAENAPSFYAPGTIHMACGRSGYLGLVRLEDGRLDLAAAWDVAWLREAGGPGRAAARLLAEVGWPALPGIEALAWRGTPALTRCTRRLAAPRFFVLGDAAGYVEPFTGEGIAWALASAVAAAPLAARACRAWSPAHVREWERTYRTVVTRRQYACRAAAEVLRRPRLARGCIGLLAYLPVLAAPLVRHLNHLPSSARKAAP